MDAGADSDITDRRPIFPDRAQTDACRCCIALNGRIRRHGCDPTIADRSHKAVVSTGLLQLL